MKALLAQMVRDSQRYYVPEGLPGREEVLRRLGAMEHPWRGLTPIHAFFLFELAPELLRTAPADVARQAYCAALEVLPGDWWGPFGSPTSDSSKRLMQIDGIDAALMRELHNEQRVAMGDSESATLAKLGKLQVADLAALMLRAMRGVSYDVRATPEERANQRRALERQLAGGMKE